MPKDKINRFIQVLRDQNWRVILLLIILTIAFSAPIYYRRIVMPVDTDYGSHISHAEAWLHGKGFETLTPSHPVLQFTLIAMRLVSRGQLSLYTALIILQVAVQVSVVLILYFWFGRSDRQNWDNIRGFAALSLTFIAPIMLVAPWDGLYYFGYIGMANYHNPTVHMLKPVALLSVMSAIRALEGRRSPGWQIMLPALLNIISAWIKPNYALSILPAIGLCIAICWYRKQIIDKHMLACGFFIPTMLVLAMQWLIIVSRFGNPNERIILAPFAVENAFSEFLFLKFLLSSAFPLFILWQARGALLNDAYLLLGWTGFLSGVTQLYLLAEGGERMLHGNFRWSAQIMLFLLFSITMRWFLREGILNRVLNNWQKVAGYLVYLAHLGGGVAYYLYCMVSTRYG